MTTKTTNQERCKDCGGTRTTVRNYPISICDQCINLEGEMCSNPQCVFCWRSMQEVAQILSDTMIRPVIDGERFPLEYSFSLADGDKGLTSSTAGRPCTNEITNLEQPKKEK